MITNEDVDNYFRKLGEIDHVDEYMGTTADYFRENLESIERFIRKSKSKRFKAKTGLASDEALSKFIFEKDGIATLSGTPLSAVCVRQYLKRVRAEVCKLGQKPAFKPDVAVPSVVVAGSSSNAKLEPSRAVSVAPVVASVSAVEVKGFLNPDESWKQEDYTRAFQKMEAEGYNFAWYEDKAIALYSAYEKNFDISAVKWDETTSALWVYARGKYPKMFNSVYFTREHSFKNGLKFGKLWDLLKKVCPFA